MDNNEYSSIRIEIDQELISVVPGFLEKRRLDCRLIEQLVAEGRLAEIQVLAHRMKGSGGSYGFDEISEIGENLEHAASIPDVDGILSAVVQLERYLSRVTVSYV